jgi:hypothetical protein
MLILGKVWVDHGSGMLRAEFANGSGVVVQVRMWFGCCPGSGVGRMRFGGNGPDVVRIEVPSPIRLFCKRETQSRRLDRRHGFLAGDGRHGFLAGLYPTSGLVLKS